MRIPFGLRAESVWTPKASRAGALHLYIYSTLRNSTPRQNVGHFAFPTYDARRAAMR